MKIKLSDFPKINVDQVTKSTQRNKSYILGPSVQKFEEQFAKYTGSESCVATGNCTDSLRMCLQAMGIGPGSRVAVPSFTWLSTAEVVKQLYASPVFVDIDHSLCMDPESLLKVIDSVDAVIYVNLFGNVADIDGILRVCGDIPVIEDNAQATGAKYKGLPLGATGTISCYSFYPTKNLATLGDAGCVIGPYDFTKSIKSSRNHGQMKTKFNALSVGWNSRMDSIHADILLNELPYLLERNKRRREIAEYYRTNIKADMQLINPDCTPVYHQFPLLVNNPIIVETHLQNKNIESRRYYGCPIHKLKTYNTGQTLPVTEHYALNNVCIPVHPYLTDAQVDIIVSEVNQCV